MVRYVCGKFARWAATLMALSFTSFQMPSLEASISLTVVFPPDEKAEVPFSFAEAMRPPSASAARQRIARKTCHLLNEKRRAEFERLEVVFLIFIDSRVT